jgi:hypothetical protein
MIRPEKKLPSIAERRVARVINLARAPRRAAWAFIARDPVASAILDTPWRLPRGSATETNIRDLYEAKHGAPPDFAAPRFAGFTLEFFSGPVGRAYPAGPLDDATRAAWTEAFLFNCSPFARAVRALRAFADYTKDPESGERAERDLRQRLKDNENALWLFETGRVGHFPADGAYGRGPSEERRAAEGALKEEIHRLKCILDPWATDGLAFMYGPGVVERLHPPLEWTAGVAEPHDSLDPRPRAPDGSATRINRRSSIPRGRWLFAMGQLLADLGIPPAQRSLARIAATVAAEAIPASTRKSADDEGALNRAVLKRHRVL